MEATGAARIGLVVPMPSELAPVVRRFGLTRGELAGRSVHTGRAGATEVVAIRSGIGTALAARATEHLLDSATMERVVVVGIAGGVGDSQVGDLIVPARVRDHRSGAEFEPAPLPGHTAAGTLVTADELLVDPQVVERLVATGVVALDMETAAVAAVCAERQVPWSTVRVISDRADDHTDDSVMQLTKPSGQPNLPAVARFLLTRPHHIPRLARLARGAQGAANRAAAVAHTAVHAMAPA